MQTSAPDTHTDLRDALRALCAQFPPEYHRKFGENETYPEEFVDALTREGWLAAMIPEEYGGSGLGLTEASIIMEEVNRCGGKTLESFDFSFQPSLDRERIAALAQLDFIRRAEVVHFLGPPGTGKSHLATALGVAAVKAGKSVYRATLADLIDALSQAEREGRLVEKIRFYTRASLLIVDEIGYLPITTGGANLFFQLVNARYEKGAMILTSNRGFAEWGEVFGDPVVATALLDRLLHHAVVIQIEGASYRLRSHADLIPEHVRANAPITPPPPPKRRGRPPKTNNGASDH
jgi:DNA replication protein DnaC